jgi:hypothetical protein
VTEDFRDELLLIVDEAPTISPEEAMSRRAVVNIRQPVNRRRVILRAAAIVCLLGGAAAAVDLRLSPSQRAPAPKPPTSPVSRIDGALFGVSCVSRTFCMAVGVVGVKDDRGLAERWNGTVWSPVTIPAPPQSTSLQMGPVACTSVTSCVALGMAEYPAQRYSSVAEHWNGASWDLESFPVPSATRLGDGSVITPSGLACVPSGYCLATGEYVDTRRNVSGTFAEQLLDDHWVPAAPAPSMFGDVACVSTTDCLAIGSNDFLVGTAVDEWHGHGWTKVPAPVDAQDGQQSDISCVSATWCMVVGPTDTGQAAFIWNGERWTTMHLPAPTEGESAGMSVSCVDASDCLLIGTTASSGDLSGSVTLRTSLFADRWDGQRWLTLPVPTVKTQDPRAGAVSCVAADYCLTGGSAGFLWNGSSLLTTFVGNSNFTQVLSHSVDNLGTSSP